MRHRFGAPFIITLLVAFVAPGSIPHNAFADQRCTPIAHVFDASGIPIPDPNDPLNKATNANCIPTYELDFTGALSGTLPSSVYHKGTCDPESKYDQVAKSIWDTRNNPPATNFYAACTRLHFTFGPLLARPGMNDSLIQVQSFEHPMYDGYTLRWKPGLQDQFGDVPAVEDLHLHHGTWIGGVNGPSSVVGPFFATGEEQTILQFPLGYGWSMAGINKDNPTSSDTNNKPSSWLMLYMIHNATQKPKVVYITYDIDYIAKAAADNLQWTDSSGQTQTGLHDVQSIWMDAGAGGNQFSWKTMSQGANTPATNVYSSFNPIFNAQRGKGHTDNNGAFDWITGPNDPSNPLYNSSNLSVQSSILNNFGSGQMICTFPHENCAAQDSSQGQSVNEGHATNEIIGHAVELAPSAFADCPELGAGKKCAVLINMGGHLHPGGLRDEVAVLRGNTIRPILISDAVYWGGPSYAAGAQQIAGAPPVSWDLSMTGQLAGDAGNGRQKDAWKILIQPGDKLMLNGVYDTSIGSAYDQMAIVMSWVHPGYEPDAIDPFDPNTIFDAGWAQGPNLAQRPPGLPSSIDYGCTPGTIPVGQPNAGKTVLCLRGNVTHASMPSREDHAVCQGCAPLIGMGAMPLMNSTITLQNFSYGQLDQSFASTFGIAQIDPKVTPQLTFYNPDTAGMIWHTITACPAPCNGQTSASYPYPASSIDSTNSYVPGTSPDFDSTILCVGLGCSTNGTTSWKFNVPTTPGIYTFFCRIHPSMRGVFQVV
ncbi:MAG: cupredoxin domain-containing protein [Actinomycetota bacterium]